MKPLILVTVTNGCDSSLILELSTLFDSYCDFKNDFIYSDFSGQKWYVEFSDVKFEKEEIKIILKVKKYGQKPSKKQKYSKQIFNQVRKKQKIAEIGIKRAQLIHSQDEFSDIFISLDKYLNSNKLFESVMLYQKNYEGNYLPLRHKNLFSNFKDEVSDFERYTYIKRSDDGFIKVIQKDDLDILDYDDSGADLQKRKFAREFAKAIYHNTVGFKQYEFLILLKNKDVFIKVEQIISSRDKRVWDKICVDDMNDKVLSKELISIYKNKKRKKQKFYKSKKELKRKLRYTKFEL